MAPVLRIFISSPGDVAEERRKARQVVDQLQEFYGPRVRLEVVLWEDLPLGAEASFQEGIDTLLSEKKGIDIAVFILWSRLGSPLGAAIRKPDGTAYRSGTEREFDLMLAARECSPDKRPHLLAYVREDLRAFQRNLEAKSTDEMEAMIRQRKLAESFIRENFHDSEGHNLRAYHTFPEPVGFARRLRVHLKEIIDERLGEGAGAETRWEGSPYRGLEVFDLEHAPVFFGREQEVYEIESRLRARSARGEAFVVIVGASGSGKSSLARAGVAHNLVHHNLEDGIAAWHHTILLPGACQGDLADGLLSALTRPTALPELLRSHDRKALAHGLRRDPKLTLELLLGPALGGGETANMPAGALLLIVDQLEEVVSDTRIGAEERAIFWRCLQALAGHPRVRVLATVRSDFYAALQQESAFIDLKGEDGQVDLLPPGTSALQRIIREPARLAGLTFAQDEKTGRTLDEDILDHIKEHPEALPLLEFALHELFERRTPDRVLTHQAFREVGGVDGALGKQAETTFGALSPEARAAFSRVFHALVTVAAEDPRRPVRRRTPPRELLQDAGARELIEAFVRQRFLVSDEDRGEAVLSLAHEALLRSWPRLSGWVEANSHLLHLRAHVEEAAKRWRARDCDASLLLADGLPLAEGRTLLRDSPEWLPDDLVHYIRESAAYAEARIRRRTRRRRVLFAGMALLTLFALIGGEMARRQSTAAEEARAHAEAERARAEIGEARAEEQRARAEAGEARATEARQGLEALLGRFVFDFRDQFRGQVRILEPMRQILAAHFADPANVDPTSVDSLHLAISFHLLEVDLELLRHRLADATARLDQADLLLNQLLTLEDASQDPFYLFNDVIVRERRSRIAYEEGRMAPAIAEGEGAIDRLDAIIALDPADTHKHLIRTLLLFTVGEWHLDAGDRRTSEARINRALTYSAETLERDDVEEFYALGIANARTRLAQLFTFIGLYDSAFAEIENLLGFMEARQAESAQPETWVASLFAGRRTRVDVLLNAVASAAALEEALALLEKTTQRFQANRADATVQFNLVAVLDDAARIHVARGEYREAAALIERAAERAAELRAYDPENALLVRIDTIPRFRTAWLANERGDHATALPEFLHIREIYAMRREYQPANTDMEHDLWACLYEIARARHGLGQFAEARTELHAAYRTIRSVEERHRDQLRYIVDRVSTLLEKAAVEAADPDGDISQGIALLGQALAALELYADTDGTGFPARELHARALSLRSELHERTGDTGYALADLRDAFQAWSELIEADPARPLWQHGYLACAVRFVIHNHANPSMREEVGLLLPRLRERVEELRARHPDFPGFSGLLSLLDGAFPDR